MVMSKGTEKKGKAQYFSSKKKGDASKDEDRMDRNIKSPNIKGSKASSKRESKQDKGHSKRPSGCMK